MSTANLLSITGLEPATGMLLTGTSGDDTLEGQGGNDTLQGNAGDDSLDGGGGIDIAVYAGVRADYLVEARDCKSIIVHDIVPGNGDEGLDTLSGIEKLRFADGDIQPSQIGEFQVNTQAKNHQGEPSVAALSDGGYVIAWLSYDQDGDEGGIYAQRYGADGERAGSEFRVNTVTDNFQTQPSVAGLSGGGFVVMWASDQDPGNTYTSYELHGQRYAADGASLGSEFSVTDMPGDEFRSAVAETANGGMVVTWVNTLNGIQRIYAQRYAANGNALGDAVLVASPENLIAPTAVVGLSGGGFVVSWESWAMDGTLTNIHAQRYTANGTAAGAEFRVNSHTDSYQDNPAIAGLASGGFVITWTSYGQDGDSLGIYGQRFAANGSRSGVEFRVNTTTDGQQLDSAVAGLSQGGFEVIWTSPDVSATGVYAQRFASDGTREGNEVLVNSFTERQQSSGSIAATQDGGFVVSWESESQDSPIYSDYGQGGVYMQRFDADGDRICTLTLSGTTGTDVADNLVGTSAGEVFAGLAGEDTLIGGGGDDSLDGGADADIAIYAGPMSDYIFSNTLRNAFGLHDANPGNGDEGSDRLSGIETVRFEDGDIGSSQRCEIPVAAGWRPAIAVLSDGGHVVTWTGGDGSRSGIFAQRYGADGRETGASFRVSTTVLWAQESPDVTAMPDGGFIVVWDSEQDGSGSGVYAQRYAANGARLGNEFQVNTYIHSDQSVPSVAGFADASFVIAWSSYDQDGNLYGVYGQRFDADGFKVGGEFRVNQTTADNQAYVQVEALGGGGFVVSWMSGNAGLGTSDVYGRVYDGAGVAVGGEFLLNTYTESDQGLPAVAALANGGFVAVWHSQDVSSPNDQDGSDYGVFGQFFDARGNKSGDEFQVNTTTLGSQSVPNVTALTDGGFVVLWISGYYYIQGTEYQTDIYAQRFDGDGKPVGEEFRINDYDGFDQQWPDAAALADGGFAITWENTQDGTIYTKRFDADGNAINELFLAGTAGNDTLRVGAGTQVLEGGLGNDTYLIDSAMDRVLENAAGGTDLVQTPVTYTLPAEVENLLLGGNAAISGTGNELANGLTGNAAANRLNGLAGADTLNGGAGNDTLVGGTGNDTYIVAQSGDVVSELAGQGIDLVKSSLSYTLGNNLENLILSGTAANGTGNALANRIIGNAGVNVLNGGGGNDTLLGGRGNDIYIVAQGGDVVIERSGQGIDLVKSSVSYMLGGNLENLLLTGTRAINGTGNELANTITGNGAANLLDGGTGADTLIGGAGADRFVVDAAADRVIEAVGEGVDEVAASVSYALAANVEKLTLTGNAAIDGSGNELANTLSGNAAANVLNGGLGVDTMIGGGGDDTYIVDARGEVVTELPGEGLDTVQSSVTRVLGANQEYLVLSGNSALNGSGNALANRISGNGAVNVLNGGGGNDTLLGSRGNDIYIVAQDGDVVIELEKQGIDLVKSRVSYALGANVENLVLTGTRAIDGTGNELANTITGNGAANVLDGGAAADILRGGRANDTYFVDDSGDRIVENVDAGRDLVNSSVSITLGANLEALVLAGSNAIDGTGNAGDNCLLGNDAANVLDGAAGADSMWGGGGDDRYVFDDAGDGAFESAGGGVDTVTSSVSYTLGDNLENLELLPAAGRTQGVGNALANRIIGNDTANLLKGLVGSDTLVGGNGNDTLIGGANADLLQGGAGNDSYTVGRGDRVTESVGEGVDTVRSYIDWTLGANFEKLVLVGSHDVNGGGNELANTISGNGSANRIDGYAGDDTLFGGDGDDRLNGGSENDVLSGGNGTDTLVGGAGADTLKGELGGDVFVFDAPLGLGNVDTVVDFGQGNDKLHLDDDVFTALSAAASTSLGAQQFQAGAGAIAAQDADDRIIYDTTTGALYYDVDGNAGAAAVQFAILGTVTHPELSAGDFLIVA